MVESGDRFEKELILLVGLTVPPFRWPGLCVGLLCVEPALDAFPPIGSSSVHLPDGPWLYSDSEELEVLLASDGDE